jgi:hypothetical protein
MRQVGLIIGKWKVRGIRRLEILWVDTGRVPGPSALAGYNPTNGQPMLRYKLDDLGSYQFEKLAQSLLKGRVGLSIESWGNRGDFGRDAYTDNSLRFPDKEIISPGPFLFQVKFVEGANAAGAKPVQALLGSVSKELAHVQRRKKFQRWEDPRCFTFMTNSLIEAEIRITIRDRFRAALNCEQVIIWGGDDICDLLDVPPPIYRAFPQLLSIRDLDQLIAGVLSNESIQRSSAALDIARELVPVFAPTASYEQAWSVLRKYHFAVLEGPPEVGKSAIAWMIALSQSSIGWEAIYSRTPEEFFEMYKPSQEQVFIADDAFGRTEYDPSRTSVWEAQLDLVLHRLNPRHWLIWTSRKHILERAVACMDVQGIARSFPEPGAILVDVQALSLEERSLVLFRHARAANLEVEARTIVRRHARQILDDPNFTPERMRRFVSESLPSIASEFRADKVSDKQLLVEIAEAIRNPTKQMRLSFRGLLPGLKWFFIALLGLTEDPFLINQMSRLKDLYEQYCPEGDRIPFERVTLEMREAFIKLRPDYFGGQRADWIHPSYRDLVIDELVVDYELRMQFFRRASLEGVKIAVSDTGGQKGERQLPFMLSSESWDVLQERCLAIVSGQQVDRALLEVLASAAARASAPHLAARWEKLLTAVCEAIRQKWDSAGRLIGAGDLAAFQRARQFANCECPLPDVNLTWGVLEDAFRDSVSDYSPGDDFNFEPFDDLTELAEELDRANPSFLSDRGFPDEFEDEIVKVIDAAHETMANPKFSDDPDQLRECGKTLSQVSTALERVSALPAALSLDTYGKSKEFEKGAVVLEERAAECEPPEPSDYGDDRRPASPPGLVFDLDALFAEL